MGGNRSKPLRSFTAGFGGASANLQPLATSIYSRRWYDNALCGTGFGVRFNRPHPAEVATFVEGPSSAATFPDLHSPIIAVARNCQPKRDHSRDDHSAEYSNKKYPYRFHSPHTTSNLAAVPTL